jgi:hypothetical protein
MVANGITVYLIPLIFIPARYTLGVNEPERRRRPESVLSARYVNLCLVMTPTWLQG